jgi:hypothetical protein
MTERYVRTSDAGVAAQAVARALRPVSGGGISGGWALQGSNLRPSDYESAALTG